MLPSRVKYAEWETRRWGISGRDPRVILLHGFTDSGESWRGVQQALAAKGRTTVAVDLPGFGEADDLLPGPILPQLDRFVTAVVAEEGNGAEGAVLVGNSLGALAALRAAATAPGVAGVVLLSEPSRGRSWLIDRFLRTPAPLWLRLLRVPLPVPRTLFVPVATRAAALALAGSGASADADFYGRIARFVAQRGGLSWAIRMARALGLESRVGYEWSRITCPVLVAHGKRDRVIPINAALDVHRSLPHSTLEIREEWGHCPQADSPLEVADMIECFVDALNRGSV